MVVYSLFIALLLLIISYLIGNYLKEKMIKGFKHYSPITIGLFFILGIFQFFVFLVVKLNLDSVFLLFALIFTLIACIALSLSNKKKIKPTLTEVKIFLLILFFVILYCMLMAFQTQGEQAFDSIHYTSMVLENSSLNKLGGFVPYTGELVGGINTQYDYQGFYHLFSMLLKVARNAFSLEGISLTPIFLNVSAILYFFILFETIVNSVLIVSNNKKYRYIFTLCLFLWSLVFFSNYFNISLSFFGNTWKTIVVSNIMMLHYIFIKTEKISILYFQIFLNASLIACSSSGFFISIFISISFFFYLVFTKVKNYRVYMAYLISCLPILVFALLYLSAISEILILIVGTIYTLLILLVFISRKFSTELWNKILIFIKILFVFIILGMIIVSFVVSQEMFPGVDAQFSGYEFFFRINSVGDMTVNYFKSINTQELIRNTIFWCLIVWFVMKKNYERDYKLFLLCIIVLFINPLVTPFVAKYMTYIVYSRSFEIFVNPFILILICNSLFFDEYESKYIILKKLCSVGIIITSCYLILFLTTNYYSNLLIPSNDYNPKYRIDQLDYDLYNFMIGEVEKSEIERPKVLSQNLGLKGYVSKIEVLLDANTYRSAPAYSDLEVNAPSEWLNIFYPRDFYGQKVWIEEPNYDNVCPAIIDSGADYVIMNRNIVHEEDKLYLPLWFKARGCAEIIYENDKWVTFVVNK